jgi:hypothetical protein
MALRHPELHGNVASPVRRLWGHHSDSNYGSSKNQFKIQFQEESEQASEEASTGT